MFNIKNFFLSSRLQNILKKLIFCYFHRSQGKISTRLQSALTYKRNELMTANLGNIFDFPLASTTLPITLDDMQRRRISRFYTKQKSKHAEFNKKMYLVIAIFSIIILISIIISFLKLLKKINFS